MQQREHTSSRSPTVTNTYSSMSTTRSLFGGRHLYANDLKWLMTKENIASKSVHFYVCTIIIIVITLLFEGYFEVLHIHVNLI